MPDNTPEFKVVKVSSNVQRESDIVYSKKFMSLWESGEAPLRIKIEQLLKAQGLLDLEEQEKKSEELRKRMKSLEITLRKAKNPDGTRMSKQEGREIALSMRKIRNEIAALTEGVSQYFNTTAESLAVLERIMFLTWACTKKPDGTEYWPTFQDYKSDLGSTVADKAMQQVMKNLWSVDDNYENKLYENSWLIKHGFMNDAGQFMDGNGNTVTEDGKRIDSKGHYLNDFGQRVDAFGNLLDENGNLLVVDEWATETEKPLPAVPVAFPGTLPEGTVIPANNQ